MGVAANADSEVNDGRRQTSTGVEGSVRWYPGAPPVFLRIGFGIAGARVSRHLSLTPEGVWRLPAVGDIPIQGVNYRNVSLNNWFIGAGVTIH